MANSGLELTPEEVEWVVERVRRGLKRIERQARGEAWWRGA